MKNMGTIDRVIRLVLAVAIATLFSMGTFSGATAIVFGIVAVAMAATAMIGWCPLYVFMGISTCQKPPVRPPSQLVPPPEAPREPALRH